jgi:hypothetical protein
MSTPSSNPEHDEAQDILEALRQIKNNPELQAEAEKNPETLLDRLNLSGIGRSAVALGIAGLTVAQSSNHLASPQTFSN